MVSDPIEGAKGGVYTLTEADKGKHITVTVSAGSGESVTSKATGKIASVKALVVMPAPGETLTQALTRLLSESSGGASVDDPVEIILDGIDIADLANSGAYDSNPLGAS